MPLPGAMRFREKGRPRPSLRLSLTPGPRRGPRAGQGWKRKMPPFSVFPVQKPQLWLADHCALVNVDKPGTFSDKTAGASAALTYCGQGEFPVPFGLPLLAKLVQAATSSSERVASCVVKVAGWLTP